MAATDVSLADINNYYHLVLPEGWDDADAVALLERSPIVARVTRIPVAFPATFDLEYVNPGGVTGNAATDAYQRYLDPAPDGIDARFAWNGAGGSGSGVGICDVEQDYNGDHADLPDVGLRGATISFPGQDDNHGTAVLGILAARNNGLGVTGIAHQAKLYFAYGLYNNVNHTPDGINNVFFLHQAITRCTAAVGDGGVILIEAQIGGPNRPANPVAGDQSGLVPTEWDESVYDVIQLAVANGITVVEAAGNGAEDLDGADYQTGNGGHHPFQASNDSGAILVGAGRSPYFAANARSAHTFTNFGQTLDLQGWGDNIVTAGYGTLYPGGATPDAAERNRFYAVSFGGTSGASPIVAGAAAIVQSTHKHVTGNYMSPAQVKELLRTTGTAQLGTKSIGPLPNLRAAIEQIYADAGVNLAVAQPVISPSGGTVAMPLQVQIGYGPGQSGSNTNLRYTLDGSEPTADSYIIIPEQGDTLYLNYGVTVKAKAFQYNATAGRSLESATTTETYVSSTPKVNTPLITPGAGTFNQPHQVTLSTTTPGATIRYRTDGRSPSFFYPGTLYNGPIALAQGTYEITARGYKDGYYKSDVAESGEIVVNPITLPSPTIYPGTGNFNGSVTVYIGSTVLGATIHYSFDGVPDENSPIFTEPITIEAGDATVVKTLRARVFLDGYTPSAPAEAVYTVIGKPDAPDIQPATQEHLGSVEVSMTSNVAGGAIRYTTNGAEPTSYSTLYAGPFSLGPGVHEVKAKVFLIGASPSDTATRTYTVYSPDAAKVETPRAIPAGGNHTISVTVRLETDTFDADIFYTIGEEILPAIPTQSDTLYDPASPIVLQYDPNVDFHYVRAKAFKNELLSSDDLFWVYKVFTAVNTVEMPTVNLPGGVYTEPISVDVDLSRNPPFVVPTLFSTTDGTDPFVPANTAGDLPPLTFDLEEATRIKALGAQLAWFNSPILDESYTFVCDTPQITPGGVYTASASVALWTTTPDASIYYTTDGSEPNESSSEYSAPVELGIGTTTVRARCYRGEFTPSDIALETFVVNPPPVAPAIIQDPAGAAVYAGETLTLTVQATGVPTPTLQWQFEDVDIAGETEPELVLAFVQPGNAGAYRAVASNVAGEATSVPAAVAVLTETIAGLVAVNDGPTELGNSTAFTATVAEGAGVVYAWDFGDGQFGSGAQAVHTYAATGTYTAKVTASNTEGSLEASTQVVVYAVGEEPPPAEDGQDVYLPGVYGGQ